MNLNSDTQRRVADDEGCSVCQKDVDRMSCHQEGLTFSICPKCAVLFMKGACKVEPHGLSCVCCEAPGSKLEYLLENAAAKEARFCKYCMTSAMAMPETPDEEHTVRTLH